MEIVDCIVYSHALHESRVTGSQFLARVGFFWFPEWGFPFPAVFFSWIWFFSSCLGFFQFPLVFSVPVVGVFGSRLNTVFLVPTFGCFQFPFFFGRSFFLWVRQLPSRSCHGCFRLRLPIVVVVVVVAVVVVVVVGHCGLEFVDGTGAGGVGALLFIVVLDFVDGTGAGAVKGGNLKKSKSWRGVGREGAAPPPQMHR